MKLRAAVSMRSRRVVRPIVAASLGLALAQGGMAHAAYTTHGKVVCGQAGLYGNYSPGAGFRDLITVMPNGRGVGLRSGGGDSRAALVLYYSGGVWGFMRRVCWGQ